MWLDKYVKEVGVATDYTVFNGKECIYTTLKATDLFLAQYVENEFNAVDIVVKYLAIENFYGKNDFGLELYRKLQLKRVNEDWNERYIKLMKSFETGIDMESWLQLDLNYSIHDGAHRLALALYHGYEYVPVNIFNVDIHRRYYGWKWFEDNDFTKSEIALIYQKLNEILEICRKPYFCILWPPARFEFTNIANSLEYAEKGIRILKRYKLYFNREELKKFIYNVYETDDIKKYKLDLKYEHIMQSMDMDGYQDEKYTVFVMELKIDNPDFRLKPLSGLPQSRSTMRLKKKIRDSFKEKITDYYYDIIMHLTDNQLQNDAVKKIINDVKSNPM